MRDVAVPRMLATMRTQLLAGLAALAAAGAVAAPASADSIVFIKDHNVWSSNVDGSGARAVTRDGTADQPYSSPSQDDRGVIAAAHGYAIDRVDRSGRRVSRFVPQNLKDSSGHSTAGAPAWVALSPDGAKVAFTLTSLSCDLTIDCGARATTGVAAADGSRVLDTPGLYGGWASWVTNDRVLFHGGYLYQNQVWDLGSGAEPANWFDDQDVYGQGNSTDLGDGEVSRNGARYIAVRGYDATTQLVWYRVDGSVQSGPTPAAPQPLCMTGQDPSIKDPTINGDGTWAAWEESTGIWAKPNLDACDSPQPALILPGASEPSWGPAANTAPKQVKKKKAAKKKRKGGGAHGKRRA
jgi:hypothetical protein